MFDSYVDEVSIDKFENVFNQADCLLFCNSLSTTFGFSLLTNRPIVVLEMKDQVHYPKAFDMLNKRCCFVKTEIDNKDKVIFDEREVINAIEASSTNINYEVLNEFAF